MNAGTADENRLGKAHVAVVAGVSWLILIGILLGRNHVQGWFSRKLDSKSSGGFEMIRTDRLPLEDSAARELPRAVTPDGSPLTVKSVEGSYSKCFGEGGFWLTLRDGGWVLSLTGCIPPGSESHGSLTIDDGRLVFESYDASGKPTGKKCAATPVWWGKSVFLVGRDEVEEFLGFVRNVGPRTSTWGSLGILVLQGRRSEEPVAMRGHLVLPPEMEARILHAPLSGKLESRTADGGWKVNFGRKQGAYAGQRILTRVPSEESGSLDVVSVEEESCVVTPAENQKPEGFHEGLEVWADAKGAPAQAPEIDRLELPPANDLVRAEYNSWKEGGDWKSVPIEDAKELVRSLSSNKRYYRPNNVICELRMPPKWVFHFIWRDGIEMLVPLGPDGGTISSSERTRNGVTDGIGGTYVVTGSSPLSLVNRCTGETPAGSTGK